MRGVVRSSSISLGRSVGRREELQLCKECIKLVITLAPPHMMKGLEAARTLLPVLDVRGGSQGLLVHPQDAVAADVLHRNLGARVGLLPDPDLAGRVVLLHLLELLSAFGDRASGDEVIYGGVYIEGYGGDDRTIWRGY